MGFSLSWKLKMAKKKKKYYTVWKGHHPGVFESWEDCKAQITNFEGAQYKSFEKFDAAKQALIMWVKQNLLKVNYLQNN